MPVKTVTLKVTALTDAANRDIVATGAYFEKLRQANPVELKVKLDKAQALAESRILAREMSQTVRDQVKLDVDRSGLGGSGGLLGSIGSLLFPGGGAAGAAGAAGGIGPLAIGGGIAASIALLESS